MICVLHVSAYSLEAVLRYGTSPYLFSAFSPSFQCALHPVTFTADRGPSDPALIPVEHALTPVSTLHTSFRSTLPFNPGHMLTCASVHSRADSPSPERDFRSVLGLLSSIGAHEQVLRNGFSFHSGRFRPFARWVGDLLLLP